MSEWYNDPEFQNGETNDVNEPVGTNDAPFADTSAPEPTVSEEPSAPTVAEPTPTATTPEPPAAPYAPYSAPAPSYESPRSQFSSQPPQDSRPSYTPYSAPHSSYPNGAYPPVPPQPPKKKFSGAYIAVALLSVLCCVLLLFSSVMMFKLMDSDEDEKPGTTQITPNANEADDNDGVINENGPTLQITDAEAINDGGLATSEIVNRNLDATVVLTMYTKSSNSFYGYYYGDESDSLTEAGGASGIIMSEDGYIITNSHCVYDEDAQAEFDRIDVTLYDGRVFEGAQIVGYDPTTDLAVIKIDATGLTPAEFGDSSALSLGDRVITLGNSGGLQWSVSQGILSGQARDVYEDTGYAIKCLQVDAIINPGSSGGPLINAYGQVVGVNSAKIVLTGYEGLGFSIPINEAKEVIDDLIKYGYVTGRVSIGITGRTITSIGYEGFMIDTINSDSTLVNTKAQSGDIITHVDGVRVTDYAEMRAELTSHEVGDTVTLTLLRLDRQLRTTVEFDVTVTLQESR